MPKDSPNNDPFPPSEMSSESPDDWQDWFFHCRLLNGVEKYYPVSVAEKESLRERAPFFSDASVHPFLEFDSKTHRILLRYKNLAYFQLLVEYYYAGKPPVPEEVETNAVKIYFINNPHPLVLQMEEDQANPKDEGDQGQVNNFLYFINDIENQLLELTDEDGETAFLRTSDIALVEAPLEILNLSAVRRRNSSNTQSSRKKQKNSRKNNLSSDS